MNCNTLMSNGSNATLIRRSRIAIAVSPPTQTEFGRSREIFNIPCVTRLCISICHKRIFHRMPAQHQKSARDAIIIIFISFKIRWRLGLFPKLFYFRIKHSRVVRYLKERLNRIWWNWDRSMIWFILHRNAYCKA